jgi:hypothetical protein
MLLPKVESASAIFKTKPLPFDGRCGDGKSIPAPPTPIVSHRVAVRRQASGTIAASDKIAIRRHVHAKIRVDPIRHVSLLAGFGLASNICYMT